MNWNSSLRQIHRWMSVVFTIAVAVCFAAIGFAEEPAEWIFYLPLFPLAFLFFTGAYLFVSPYVRQWRGRRREGGTAGGA